MNIIKESWILLSISRSSYTLDLSRTWAAFISTAWIFVSNWLKPKMVTWSCLSFLAKAGRLRAIARTTAAAWGEGRRGRSLEISRLPFLTDMIITHCSSLTLWKEEKNNWCVWTEISCVLNISYPCCKLFWDGYKLGLPVHFRYSYLAILSSPSSYLSSHSFSRRELHSCTVLVLCCSSRASLSSSGAWTKRFSKSWTSSSKLYIWRKVMERGTETFKYSTVWLDSETRCLLFQWITLIQIKKTLRKSVFQKTV